MEQVKRYPFSMRENAHNIEFVRNIMFSKLHDAEISGDVPLYSELFDRYDVLTQLLLALRDNSKDGKVTWLTGKELTLAKMIVAQAIFERDNRNSK